MPEHTLHVYERSKANKSVYRCIHPACHHYNRVALLLGKESECPKCHEKFILSAKQLKNKTPVCMLCSKELKSPTLKVGVDLIKNLLEMEAEDVSEIFLEEQKDGQENLPR